MEQLGFVSALAALIGPLLVGRVVLSFFPAGWPGANSGPGVLATWGASHLLGVAVIELELTLLSMLGFAVPMIWLPVPFVLLGAVRFFTLPGAPVPGRELPSERPVGLALVLPWMSAALVALIAWPVLRGTEMPAEQAARLLAGAVSVGALLALLAFGLERARRTPYGRRLMVFGCALFFSLQAESGWSAGFSAELPAAVFGGAGVACAIGWLRRADTRCRALAAVFLAVPAGDSMAGLLLALGGLAVLVLKSPWSSRGSTLRVAGGALAVFAGVGGVRGRFGVSMLGVEVESILELGGAALVLFVIAMVGTRVQLARAKHKRRLGAAAPDADPERAVDATDGQIAYLQWSVAAALVGLALAAPFSEATTALPVAPALFLVAGLDLVRAERIA